MTFVCAYIIACLTVTSLSYKCVLSVDIDPKTPMSKAFEKYGLDQNTVDFIGHALALHRDDEYVVT